MIETRMENGLLWPKKDRDCAAVVFKTTGDMEPALKFCENKMVAVQAGGNCGVWPLWLAERFTAVYTFEPDPTNFFCLAYNCKRPNVFTYQAALGDGPMFVDMKREERNIGAHYVQGSGLIPTLRIDDFGFEQCDYICLDVEGYEMKALKGAVETIQRCKPVIQIEDKGLSDKYGTSKGDIENWLCADFGYKVVDRPNRDVILA